MKYIFTLTFLIAFFFTKEEMPTVVYPKFQSWIYQHDEDLKKDIKDVKEKKQVDIGDKLNVIKEKKYEGIKYYQIEFQDKTKYWINSNYVTTKYIIITSQNLTCYTDASLKAVNKDFKLEYGDLGYVIKEKKGFINTEFITFVPRGKNNKIIWLGSAWIKDGYITDIKAAKEAYWLNLSYNQLNIKTPNIGQVKRYLKMAIAINGKDKTEIAKFAEKKLKELN